MRRTFRCASSQGSIAVTHVLFVRFLSLPFLPPFFQIVLTTFSPAACHFPSSCPADVPCDKLIEVSCTCGHLSQKARCGANDENPAGNQGRNIKCTSACDVAKRQAQLAEALGIEKKEPKVREVTPEPATLAYFEANKKWAADMETQLTEFVKGDKPSLHFPAMKRDQRQFVRLFLFRTSSPLTSLTLFPSQIHELCEQLFDLRSESLDPEPRRSIVAHRTTTCGVPATCLTDVLAASKKVASSTLSFGNLRRALPERLPNNALYLEGVLGYDEEMLREILAPSMRGMLFQLTWVVRCLPFLLSSSRTDLSLP